MDFKITKQGISQAIFMAIRLIFLVVGTSLLTLTTSPIELTDGIERLLNPFKKDWNTSSWISYDDDYSIKIYTYIIRWNR